MTSSDVMTLYALLDESRKETRQALAEVSLEVRGYRAELNGRLKTLEIEAARKDAVGATRMGVWKLVVSVAAVAASIGSVVGVLVAVL